MPNIITIATKALQEAIQSGVNTLTDRLTADRAGNLDKIDTPISSRMSEKTAIYKGEYYTTSETFQTALNITDTIGVLHFLQTHNGAQYKTVFVKITVDGIVMGEIEWSSSASSPSWRQISFFDATNYAIPLVPFKSSLKIEIKGEDGNEVGARWYYSK